MRTIVYILISFLLIQISLPVRAETAGSLFMTGDYSQYRSPGYLTGFLAANNAAPGPLASGSGEIQYEHPLRRFEITFFISLPFVFVVSFASLHTFDAIKRKNTNVNVWKNYKPYLLGATFSISAVIAFREAWICMDLNKKRNIPGQPENRENIESINEQNIYIYAVKRY